MSSTRNVYKNGGNPYYKFNTADNIVSIIIKTLEGDDIDKKEVLRFGEYYMIGKKIAIIPARSGSKGLKDKNIKLLNGRPLMAYTIEAALNSRIFDIVIVSTDSREYADIALKYGADVPELRPNELAGDNISTIDVVLHVISMYERMNMVVDDVCVLQPTSPLRGANEIRKAFNLFTERNAKTVVSVCECEHSPLWTGRLDESLRMDDFVKDNVSNLPRQRLDRYYRINGGLYFAKVEFLKKTRNFVTKETIAYIMDRKVSIDIDNQDDFEYCEYLLKNKTI